MVTIYQDFSNCIDMLKNIADRGRGQFILCIYRGNVKNFFQYNLEHWMASSKIFQITILCQKRVARGHSQFFLCIYIDLLNRWQYLSPFKLACLFALILYVPSTIFQLNGDGSSWVKPVLS